MSTMNKEDNEMTEEASSLFDEKGKRPWKPNKERIVRSKKSLDSKKMAQLKERENSVYRGELDPRKIDQKEKRKPRTISRSEEKVRKKARSLAENDPVIQAQNKKTAYTDFRNEYYPCKASPARLGALYATQQVRQRNAYAQEVIGSSIDHSHLSAEDKAFATLLTLGVVSSYGSLDEVINKCLEKPTDIKVDVRDALRISCYEIIYLRKEPHAAVDQGVELVRAVATSAAGLGNAVLHRILDLSDAFPFNDPSKDIEALALKYAFPVWLAKLLVTDMGAKDAISFMKASNEPAPLYIAVNSIRATNNEIVHAFKSAGSDLDPATAGNVEIPGCFRVSNTHVLADARIEQLFSQGKILVSDAAAQAVALGVAQIEPCDPLLEIGAGRGTKTLLIQSDAFREHQRQLDLTPLDLHKFKCDLLEERCAEYGAHIDTVLTGNATRLDAVIGDTEYQNIFVDAPCSGLGTLRRHHEIRWRITPDQIEDLTHTDLAILKSASSHVKLGGSLIYSTCTVTYAENTGMVKEFLATEEGSSFKLAPLFGRSCFSSKLTSGSPDAHFAVRFIRVSSQDRKCDATQSKELV